MTGMTLQEKLRLLKDSNKAILAANFYNFETISGIIRAAGETSSPVILQLSESSIQYMGLKVAASMARAALAASGVEGWLHLDHGSSEEQVARCLDAGFDSVMIDASEKSFLENVQITSRVVKRAEKYHANVEAELGYVAKLGQISDGSGFTNPADAKSFAEQTGITALAVAIGSAHGFYKEEPKLDIPLLAMIRKNTTVPLVLHGSSGIHDQMLQEAIRNGIVKINLATEIKNIFMQTLQEILEKNTEIDLRKVFPAAINAVKSLICNKFLVINQT
jgi:tagatose 1,6-diphosphate aldolase GatY/KbaY